MAGHAVPRASAADAGGALHCRCEEVVFRAGTNSQQGPSRLLALGVTGAWAHTYTCPKWPDTLREKVAEAIMKQRGLDEGLRRDPAQGPQYVRPKNIDKTGLPVWRDKRLRQQSSEPNQTVGQNGGTTAKGYHIQCQKCPNTIELKGNRLLWEENGLGSGARIARPS